MMEMDQVQGTADNSNVSTDKPNPYSFCITDEEFSSALHEVRSKFKISHEWEIVQLTKAEIQKATRLSIEKVQDFLIIISESLCGTIQHFNCLEMMKEKTRKLSFGCPVLDSSFGGGLLSKGITEIVGEAGSGKSQLCMQLSLQVQLPLELGGLGGGACYISTENSFQSKRLEQMVESYRRKYPQLSHVDFMSQIYTESIPTTEKLWELLSERLPKLLSIKNVRLVVVDSLAALFRFEYSGNEAVARSKMLWRQANQLKLLSDRFDTPIVVVNQVSDLFQNTPVISALPGSSKVIPALGLTWSNCVNARFLLVKTHQMVQNPVVEEERQTKRQKTDPVDCALRRMHVILSSHLANVTSNFVVTRDGLLGLPT